MRAQRAGALPPLRRRPDPLIEAGDEVIKAAQSPMHSGSNLDEISIKSADVLKASTMAAQINAANYR